MPTVYDLPQDLLIKRLAEHLKKFPQLSPPTWVAYVKTGAHAERPPQDKDWWYIRCASLLRKLYVHGPMGLSELKSKYGGGRSTGYAPRHHRDAGGSIIRKALQQLETVGLVKKQDNKGRMLTARGFSLLDNLSNTTFKEQVKVDPSLSKYS